ncbi:MAG: DNA-binding NarL/FixJ family response regulator, partial [Cyclobacteriaceae bacterium]
DDHSLFGSGLATLLENRGFEVVGQVLNGKDVIYKTISLQPDLIILDLNLPKKNGLEVLKEIKEYQKEIVVIIVTMYSDDYLIKEVRKLGGNGYFLKNSDQDELIAHIHTLKYPDFYLTKSIKKEVNEDLIEDEFPSAVKLTKREREILSLLVEGLSSKEIAIELDISPATVDTHRKNMLKKLSFNKVSELVSYAHRNNLI